MRTPDLNDMTLPYPPPPKRVDPGPDATLPTALTDVRLSSVDEPALDPTFRAQVGKRLDDHFAPQAELRMRWALDGCRTVLERGSGGPGAQELSFNLAKSAAHWRSVAEDLRRGDVLVVAELAEDQT